jgi:hypothetical protein
MAKHKDRHTCGKCGLTEFIQWVVSISLHHLHFQ